MNLNTNNSKTNNSCTFSCLRVGDLQVEIIHQLPHFGFLDDFFPQISNRYIDTVKCQRFELVVAFEFIVHRRHADVCVYGKTQTTKQYANANKKLSVSLFERYLLMTTSDCFALYFLLHLNAKKTTYGR